MIMPGMEAQLEGNVSICLGTEANIRNSNNNLVGKLKIMFGVTFVKRHFAGVLQDLSA